MKELPEDLRLKAVELSKALVGIDRPTQEHGKIMDAFTEFYNSMSEPSTIEENGSFDMGQALKIAEFRVLANPYFRNITDKDSLIMARALGMKDQHRINEEYIRGRKDRVSKKYRTSG